MWAFPPFSVVGRVLEHMRLCGVMGAVVLPIWILQVWWPVVLEHACDAMLLPAQRGVFVAPDNGVVEIAWRCMVVFFDFTANRESAVATSNRSALVHGESIGERRNVDQLWKKGFSIYALVQSAGPLKQVVTRRNTSSIYR